MSNPVLARAKGALDFLSAQPDAQELARQRELAQYNYNSAIHEAEVRGKAEALLSLLDTRGMPVTEAQRKRIMGCRDVPRIEQWLRRAVSVLSVDELLG